jgi:hypothetical protein
MRAANTTDRQVGAAIGPPVPLFQVGVIMVTVSSLGGGQSVPASATGFKSGQVNFPILEAALLP